MRSHFLFAHLSFLLHLLHILTADLSLFAYPIVACSESSPHKIMDALPNELFIQIASHLAAEAPSITRFNHEPSAHLTESEFTPLKHLSLVSWRWRKITLPILFHNSRIPLDKEPKWVPIDARLVDSMQTQLTTLSNHEFQIYQKMRSKFKSSSSSAYNEAFDDLLINLCSIQDGDDFLKNVPHILWIPHLSRACDAFARFVTQYDLKPHIRSVVVHTDKEYELRHVRAADAPLARAVADIWSFVFRHLEPSRVVVAAPPTTLAELVASQVLSSDIWAFEMKMQYVELLQSEPSRLEHMKSKCRAWDSALIHRRPWTHLGYNEGSSIPAYSTYEYHLKQSSKVLYLILVRLAKEVQPCCNITSFSINGIFPFVTNVVAIINALHRIPTLKHVSFQLAPGAENNVLDDPKRIGRAQRSDFWLEWNESYHIICNFLRVFEFADGAEFRSRDCGNDHLAQDVSGYMDLVQQRGVGWRRIGEEQDLWVRDHALDHDVDSVTELGIV